MRFVADGARRMLAAALEAEVDAYVSSRTDEIDEDGHRLVVRNGHAQPRSLVTTAGSLEVRAPRVNDRRIDADSGERVRFRSSILPPWARRSPKVAEVLPLMYLHGVSSGDFAPALEEFFGSAAGLSASVITRLTTGVISDYWSVRVGGTLHPDLAWSYDFPTRELLPIAGLVAFYNEKVDAFVDGQLLARPKTHFFK